MGLFRRHRAAGAAAPPPRRGEARAAAGEDSAHLRDFIATRVGVEAYVEPENAQTPVTILLIATDGEWTRRRVPSPAVAWDFARGEAIPVYDVNHTGYPQRMRDYNARARRGGTAPSL